MVKKKAKGKGKKKKKDKKEKTGINHLEREMYLQNINELQHKVDWRNHMCNIMNEDLKECKVAQEKHKADEKLAVECLEEAIQDHKRITARTELSVLEAKKLKTQTEERLTLEMASDLMKMNEEQLFFDRQIEDMKKKVKLSEAFNDEQIERKIEAIENQLQKDNDGDVITKRQQQEQRRIEAFKKDAQDILKKEADDFQDEIAGIEDKNFARIMEETRWWEDLVNDLRISANRLETLNEEKQIELDDLKGSKKDTLESNQQLHDGRIFLNELIHRREKLESLREADYEYKKERSIMDQLYERLMQNVIAKEKQLEENLLKMSENESEIQSLENKLLSKISLGCKMYEFIERAKELLAKEAMQPFLLTRNGPPKDRETLIELSLLFEEAENFFANKSVQ